MTEIQFYHLRSTPLERALPKLLEKAYHGGFRVLVLAGDEATVARLDTALWSYDAGSFLPHGTAKDGNGDHQPIYLTAREENPNNADLLAVTDGSPLDELTDIRRVLDIFDGSDETAVQKARKRWKDYKTAGHNVTYIRQTESGGWEQVSERA